MHTGIDLLVLIFVLGGAWFAAAFAALGFFRAKAAPQLLMTQAAAQLLRSEWSASSAGSLWKSGRKLRPQQSIILVVGGAVG
jgi:hypothetical protein